MMQYLLVGLALAWSLLRVTRQLFPGALHAGQNRLAQRAAKRGWQRLGSWLQSGERSAGCGSGCNTCGSCATTAAIAPERPVQLRGVMADRQGINDNAPAR